MTKALDTPQATSAERILSTSLDLFARKGYDATSVREICEAAGIKNIITKSFNTSNQVTVVKATIEALRRLRTQQDVERLRGNHAIVVKTALG